MTNVTNMTPRQVMEEWFERLWHRRDTTAIDELRAASAQAHGLAPRDLDASGFHELFQRACSVFDEMRVTIEDTIEVGDRIALRICFRASTGDRQFEVHGMGMATVRDGRIVESWNSLDVASLMAQAREGARTTTLSEAVDLLARSKP